MKRLLLGVAVMIIALSSFRLGEANRVVVIAAADVSGNTPESGSSPPVSSSTITPGLLPKVPVIRYVTDPVITEALALAAAHGIRPYWTAKPFRFGESVPADQADDVLAHLIPCENKARLEDPSSTPRVLDSNDKYSYGILQIQSGTWAGWVASHWALGNAEDDEAAINGSRNAIEHGQLYQWSCATILGIVQ